MTTSLQVVVLCAASAGAFLSRFSNAEKPTWSWGTVWTVLVTAVVTYLAMDSGLLPDSWLMAATVSPVKAGAIAFVLSGLGGAVLVDKAQDIITAISAPKKPSGGG
jgi:hypothetical protein